MRSGREEGHQDPLSIIWAPSPFHSKGWWNPPTNCALHCTTATIESTLNTFTNPYSTRKVSAHFTVDGFAGKVYQHVALNDRAWHALGANEFAYGIEFVNNVPHGPVPEAAYWLGAWLIREVIAPHLGGPIDDEVYGPHSRWVATACPSGLDWPRIISEAGGEMPDYVSRQEMDAYKADVRSSFESVKEAFHKHTHGGVVIPSASAIRLPAGPTKRTAASARKGHGRGKSRDVKEK